MSCCRWTTAPTSSRPNSKSEDRRSPEAGAGAEGGHRRGAGTADHHHTDGARRPGNPRAPGAAGPGAARQLPGGRHARSDARRRRGRVLPRRRSARRCAAATWTCRSTCSKRTGRVRSAPMRQRPRRARSASRTSRCSRSCSPRAIAPTLGIEMPTRGVRHVRGQHDHHGADGWHEGEGRRAGVHGGGADGRDVHGEAHQRPAVAPGRRHRRRGRSRIREFTPRQPVAGHERTSSTTSPSTATAPGTT